MQPLKDGAWVPHHDFITGRIFQPAGLAPNLITSADWASGLLRQFGAKGATSDRPALFWEAIEASNRHNTPLAIEIKFPASCSAVKALYRRARDLHLPPSWHTPFAELLPCLAQLEAGDIGFVIGPDPGKTINHHARIPLARSLSDSHFF